MPAFQQLTHKTGTSTQFGIQLDLKSDSKLTNSPTIVVQPLAMQSTVVLQDVVGYRRSHALVAIWCGNLIRVRVFDCGDSGSTLSLESTEDADRFIRCVTKFLSVDESGLGLHSDAAANAFSVTLNKTEFVVKRAHTHAPPYGHPVSSRTTC